MSARRIGAVLLAAASGTAFGQTPPAQPRFEVASIKPSNPADPHPSISFNGGAFKSTGHTLRDFIAMSWDVRPFQVVGGPAWLGSDKYDIEAKPAVPRDVLAPGSERQVRLMIQSLLADRFQLKVHRETKEMRVYFLVAGKNGARIKKTAEAAGAGTSMHDGKGQLFATQIEMGMLARELGGLVEGSVIDRTGLTGAYDIHLEWSGDEVAAAPDSGSRPSIFSAVQEQLGLRLEPGKGPVEMLVVDGAEKASPN